MAEWTNLETAKVKLMKEQGFGVKDIAKRIHRRTEDVCELVREEDYVECACCKRSTPRKCTQTYIMTNESEQICCAACSAVVDWVNDL